MEQVNLPRRTQPGGWPLVSHELLSKHADGPTKIISAEQDRDPHVFCIIPLNHSALLLMKSMLHHLRASGLCMARPHAKNSCL